MAFATSALSDTPLSPPADFTHRSEVAIVDGRVETNTTIIVPTNRAPWIVPVWARFYLLAPDALSILVLNGGGNLLGSRDPEQIVATVFYVEDGAVRAQHFKLADIMDPNDMTRTVSHYSWFETHHATDQGWELGLSDGKTVTITYH